MKLKYYLLYGVIYALVAGTICMEQKKKLLSRNTVKHGQRKNQLFLGLCACSLMVKINHLFSMMKKIVEDLMKIKHMELFMNFLFFTNVQDQMHVLL